MCRDIPGITKRYKKITCSLPLPLFLPSLRSIIHRLTPSLRSSVRGTTATRFACLVCARFGRFAPSLRAGVTTPPCPPGSRSPNPLPPALASPGKAWAMAATVAFLFGIAGKFCINLVFGRGVGQMCVRASFRAFRGNLALFECFPRLALLPAALHQRSGHPADIVGNLAFVPLLVVVGNLASSFKRQGTRPTLTGAPRKRTAAAALQQIAAALFVCPANDRAEIGDGAVMSVAYSSVPNAALTAPLRVDYSPFHTQP